MILDNENIILSYLKGYCRDNTNILLCNGNSYEKKILKHFREDEFTDNSGHDKLSPDFYSEKYSIMFDITRINDSEIKKTYNPIKIREKNIRKHLSQNFDDTNEMNVYINSVSKDVEEHSYDKYIKQSNRVIKEHIRKIPEWISQHPNIKNKGLLITDETECYFDGYIKYAFENKFQYGIKKPVCLHEPWNDKQFIQNLYNQNLDFVIWFNIYKPYGVPREIGIWYPTIVIMDVRFPRTNDFKNYNIRNLVCL